MSRVGPMTLSILSMNDRVMSSISSRSRSPAGTLMPPLAPPNGMPTIAVF
jgi:hypothetical protein